jgi:hypothetical protein
VSYGLPHSNIGNPPLLKVQLYNYSGSIIQQFNYWHPLYALQFQDDGKDHLQILPNAIGRFVFSFDPKIALMNVSYFHHNGGNNNTYTEKIASFDLRPTILKFCKQFPHDPDCRSSDLAVVNIHTSTLSQQLPIIVGDSANVTVHSIVSNTGPDAHIDAIVSSKANVP